MLRLLACVLREDGLGLVVGAVDLFLEPLRLCLEGLHTLPGRVRAVLPALLGCEVCRSARLGLACLLCLRCSLVRALPELVHLSPRLGEPVQLLAEPDALHLELLLLLLDALADLGALLARLDVALEARDLARVLLRLGLGLRVEGEEVAELEGRFLVSGESSSLFPRALEKSSVALLQLPEALQLQLQLLLLGLEVTLQPAQEVDLAGQLVAEGADPLTLGHGPLGARPLLLEGLAERVAGSAGTASADFAQRAEQRLAEAHVADEGGELGAEAEPVRLEEVRETEVGQSRSGQEQPRLREEPEELLGRALQVWRGRERSKPGRELLEDQLHVAGVRALEDVAGHSDGQLLQDREQLARGQDRRPHSEWVRSGRPSTPMPAYEVVRLPETSTASDDPRGQQRKLEAQFAYLRAELLPNHEHILLQDLKQRKQELREQQTRLEAENQGLRAEVRRLETELEVTPETRQRPTTPSKSRKFGRPAHQSE